MSMAMQARLQVPFAVPAPGEHDSRSLRMLSYRLRVFDLILRDVLGPGEGRAFADLGAGPLPFSRRARDVGYRVTAVDARPPWAGQMPEGVTHVYADVRDFDLSGFDVIGLIGLLYHLPLEAQVDLLRRCAGRPAVVDTEVFDPSFAGAGGRLGRPETRLGMRGAAFAETGHAWSAAGDTQSFWLEEEALVELFSTSGWKRVTRCDPAYASPFGPRRWFVLQ